MAVKFNVKIQANSLSKMMDMANRCMTKPGGAIHTERLIDYASEEFGRLTIEQCLAVLAEIDADYEKKLFKDGYGVIIGYAYSRNVFVTLRREQSSTEGEFAKIAKKLKVNKA